MDEKEKEPIRKASEVACREFKTLVDSNHLDSLKQTQLLMYLSRSLTIDFVDTLLFFARRFLSNRPGFHFL